MSASPPPAGEVLTETTTTVEGNNASGELHSKTHARYVQASSKLKQNASPRVALHYHLHSSGGRDKGTRLQSVQHGSSGHKASGKACASTSHLSTAERCCREADKVAAWALMSLART